MTSVNQWNFGTSSQLAVLSCNVYSVVDARSAYGDLQISFVNVVFFPEQMSFKHDIKLFMAFQTSEWFWPHHDILWHVPLANIPAKETDID